MTKLYRAEVTKVIYFLAEDVKDAVNSIPDYINKEYVIDQMHFGIVSSKEDISPDWKHSLVYGSKEDVTALEAFERFNK